MNIYKYLYQLYFSFYNKAILKAGICHVKNHFYLNFYRKLLYLIYICGFRYVIRNTFLLTNCFLIPLSGTNMVTCETSYSVQHPEHMSKLKNDRVEPWQASQQSCWHELWGPLSRSSKLRMRNLKSLLFSEMFRSLDASLSLLEF